MAYRCCISFFIFFVLTSQSGFGLGARKICAEMLADMCVRPSGMNMCAGMCIRHVCRHVVQPRVWCIACSVPTVIHRSHCMHPIGRV